MNIIGFGSRTPTFMYIYMCVCISLLISVFLCNVLEPLHSVVYIYIPYEFVGNDIYVLGSRIPT